MPKSHIFICNRCQRNQSAMMDSQRNRNFKPIYEWTWVGHKDLEAKIVNGSMMTHLKNRLWLEIAKYNRIWYYFQAIPGGSPVTTCRQSELMGRDSESKHLSNSEGSQVKLKSGRKTSKYSLYTWIYDSRKGS